MPAHQPTAVIAFGRSASSPYGRGWRLLVIPGRIVDNSNHHPPLWWIIGTCSATVTTKGRIVGDVATDARLTVPEAARRLGLPGGDVYRLVFTGALVGAPDEDGAVYILVDAVDRYVAEHPAVTPHPR